eukprot:TRINITY_DN7600_c1_g2_i2.p1 TRINITY_DN7600_c1_g2~~TRINITY_DN7600_c1_g2_i2.p1  ORF type:complete len:448 (-),score=46.08 TRINITY_DN7600_c1_g2_i2:75-1289(-)
MYATYRRCTLNSKLLRYSYNTLTVILALYTLFNAIVSKEHLLQEELLNDHVLFSRIAESPLAKPRCSALNATGLCVEWSWLEAVDSSSDRLFLATWAQETLFVGGPRLQRLGDQTSDGGQRRTGWQRTANQSFYVAQPEVWDLLLEHRLASSMGTWSGQDLHGFLRRRQDLSEKVRDHVMKGVPKDPKVQFGTALDQADRRVRISIGDLLASLDLELDQECEKCAAYNVTGEAARLRRTGVELDVTLFYSNLWFDWESPSSWFLPSQDISFELQVASRQPREGVRTIRTVGRSELLEQVPPGTAARVQRRTHGVRMFFHQRGVLGKFDIVTFIAFVVKSLTFLTIAWSVSELLVDATAIWCNITGKHVPAWYQFLNSYTTLQEMEEHDQAGQKDGEINQHVKNE